VPGSVTSAGDEEDAIIEEQVSKFISIDDYLGHVGEFGYYQKKHYFLVASAWIPCSWITLSMVFVNSRPFWSYVDGNSTIMQTKLPCDVTSTNYNSSVFVIEDQWRSIQGTWELICEENEWKATLVNSLFFVGFGIGASCFGTFADMVGRHRAFFTAGALSSASALLCAAAPQFEVYVALRLLTGIGIGGFGIVTYVLASEVIGPSWQGMTGVGQAGIFSVGNVLLAPLAFMIPGWRAFSVATGLSPLLWLLLYRVIPESPRWLLANGNQQSATAIMEDIATANGSDPPAGQVLGTASQEDDSGAEKPGISALFKGVMLKRTLVMLFVWFANSFVYYGLSLNSGNMGGSLYFNFAVGSLTELPSLCVGAYLVDRLGRRWTLAGGMILSGLSCGACMFLPEGTPSIIAAQMGHFGITPSFAIIFVYAAELFPTVVRSVAMGLSSTAARVGGVAAPLVVMLSLVSDSLPLLVFAIVALAAGALILTLPETLNLPLPETLEDCENMGKDPASHTSLEETVELDTLVKE